MGHQPADHTHADHAHVVQAQAGHSHVSHTHTAHTTARPAQLTIQPMLSVLGWPAWLRVLAVLPVLLLLWLAVAWASAEVVPW